ncbi:hypothetical protein RRG08_059364 [Elysia crispata]|uniref:Uncharacterized protein n=1 Tax=Elysia crispata TaxID=231223 RepID=A0AAE1BEF4_9GAST|nr:hypothetical protein RRG08_059364 [Elysia crispata]
MLPCAQKITHYPLSGSNSGCWLVRNYFHNTGQVLTCFAQSSPSRPFGTEGKLFSGGTARNTFKRSCIPAPHYLGGASLESRTITPTGVQGRLLLRETLTELWPHQTKTENPRTLGEEYAGGPCTSGIGSE